MARGARGGQRDRVVDLPLALPGAVPTYPFGDDVLVYKVGVSASGTGRHSGGKIFALVALTGTPGLLTLKAEPDRAVALVQQHTAVVPGYHMDKRHWISVALDGSLPDDAIRELVEDSYDLVLGTLTARGRFEADPDRFPLPGRHRPGPGS